MSATARPAHRVDALAPIPLRNQRRITTPEDFEQITVPYMGGEVCCAVGYEDGALYLYAIQMGGWFSAIDMLSDTVFRALETAAVKAYREENEAIESSRAFDDWQEARQ